MRGLGIFGKDRIVKVVGVVVYRGRVCFGNVKGFIFDFMFGFLFFIILFCV